jgi:hypothetical protein
MLSLPKNTGQKKTYFKFMLLLPTNACQKKTLPLMLRRGLPVYKRLKLSISQPPTPFGVATASSKFD